MDFKAAFNWLAQRPKRNYTLGEVFQHYVRGKEWSQIDDNRLNFSRGGRAAERTATGLGLACAGILIAGLNTPSCTAAFVVAATMISVGKVSGVVVGKLIDFNNNVPKFVNKFSDKFEKVVEKTERFIERKLNP